MGFLSSSSFVTLLFLLCGFSSLWDLCIARGGEQSSYLSGAMPGNGVFSRSLFWESPPVSDEQVKGYMSNLELEKAMKGFVERCSSISRMYSIGMSVNGFPLWVLEISDKPGQEEPEPAFKFIGNVHGDEPVGRELLLLLANWLCDNYLKDDLVLLFAFHDQLNASAQKMYESYGLRRPLEQWG